MYQILAVVLDAVPFFFSIRLAAVAVPKEQTIIEKWLTENLEQHKEAFCEVILVALYLSIIKCELFSLAVLILVSLFSLLIQECIKFLKEVSIEMSDGANSIQAAVALSYKEMLATFLKVLYYYAPTLTICQSVLQENVEGWGRGRGREGRGEGWMLTPIW